MSVPNEPIDPPPPVIDPPPGPGRVPGEAPPPSKEPEPDNGGDALRQARFTSVNNCPTWGMICRGSQIRPS